MNLFKSTFTRRYFLTVYSEKKYRNKLKVNRYDSLS